jgi:hypothetical protein
MTMNFHMMAARKIIHPGETPKQIASGRRSPAFN